MPDVDATDARRGAQLFPVLFWGGVGLAPLAALLILLGSGGTPVRIGAVLGVLAPVLIGISFALRPDPDSIRLQFEETLLEELDLLRTEVRDEIANSARASHQMVGERLGALQQTVDGLRAAARMGQLPATAQPAIAPTPYQVTAAAAPPPPAAPVASRAAVPRSAAPRSAAPRSAAPPTSAGPPPSMVPRSAAPPPGRRTPPASAAPFPPAGNGRASVPAPAGRRSADRPARHQADGYAPAAGSRATPPGDGYRSRPTYADENGHNGDRGRGPNGVANGASNGHGGGRDYPASAPWSPPAPRGRSQPQSPPPPEPYEESWTDQKLRERYGRRPRPYGDDTNGSGEWQQQRWEPISAEPVTRGRRRRWEEDSSLDALRDGSGRHSDAPGSQAGYDYGNGYSNGNGYGDARPDYTRRALPPGGDASGEPSWNDSWDEPAREARSHRYRPDFELTDERWR